MSGHSILAIDLGTDFGWAVYQDGKVVSGQECAREASGLHVGYRFKALKNFLERTFSGVDEVVYEDVKSHGEGGYLTGRYYGAFFGILSSWCAENRIPLYDVHVMTLKKHFTGKGNAKKIDMCNKAISMGWRGGKVDTDLNNDEADAIALLNYILDIKYNIKLKL